ncbi:hypothetical protein GOODEAATRI_027362 [Goodea atripinnis]|uniref:C-type lectin domain-containing protein n=1 Tax=Goodea atripinnis TaxID=208336 RepID=A0ABV0NHD2_9TELE
MMEKILLGVVFLADCLILSSCVTHQFIFVSQSLTWTEAQNYCRENYKDLATIKNNEEMKQLNNTLISALHNSEAWIGVYSVINWKWSNGFNGSGADYRNWATYDEDPDFVSANQFCVCTDLHGRWWDDYCTLEYPFICYNGTQLHPEFVLVNKPMNWIKAKEYCRNNFIDLATVRNNKENQKFQSLVPSGNWAWIGLFRDPDFYWSDRSNFLFSNWGTGSNLIGSMTAICGETSLIKSGKWKFRSCETKLPFICYSIQAEMKHTVKLSLKTEDSDDVINPVLKGKLQKKLQDRLEEKGVRGITMNWT